MRYEAVRLLQFVFSLSLIFLAFMGGMYVGWRRWGRRNGPADLSAPLAEPAASGDARSDVQFNGTARHDLFAPELDVEVDLADVREPVDMRVGAGPQRLGLPAPGVAAPGVAAPELNL